MSHRHNQGKLATSALPAQTEVSFIGAEVSALGAWVHEFGAAGQRGATQHRGGGGTCPGDGGYWRRSSPLRPLLGHDLGGVQEKVMNHSECLGGVPLGGGAPAE